MEPAEELAGKNNLGVAPGPYFNCASVSETVVCGRPERIDLLKGKKKSPNQNQAFSQEQRMHFD